MVFGVFFFFFVFFSFVVVVFPIESFISLIQTQCHMGLDKEEYLMIVLG